ncbi:MAG: DUF5320 family protein [Methanoregula sp.]|nr:DUF5320 family protein [Methanoregula sp.]
MPGLNGTGPLGRGQVSGRGFGRCRPAPVQLIVFALVTILYIPCISVILVLASEFGWKKAHAISALEVVLAIAVGGIVFRALSLGM